MKIRIREVREGMDWFRIGFNAPFHGAMELEAKYTEGGLDVLKELKLPELRDLRELIEEFMEGLAVHEAIAAKNMLLYVQEKEIEELYKKLQE